LRQSYPMTYDLHESFFDNVKCKYPLEDEWLTATGAKVVTATAGFFNSEASANAGNGQDGNNNVDALLNNVSGAFKQGLICCPTGETPVGDYYFLSTRNNNFSNRAQKLKIKVVDPTDPGTNAVGTAAAFSFYPTENVELMNKKYPDPTKVANARRRRRASQ